MDEAAWRKQLEQHRMEKDEAFRLSEHSPIPVHERSSFKGLHYYAPDARYRLVVALEPPQGGSLAIPRTGGDEVPYERLGRLRLDLPDGSAHVTLFAQAHGDHHRPFLPIRDATSGNETYGAGRYLDPAELEDGRYLVDLNELYHPFCAYDEAFTCPMTPPENHLPFAVRAGERLG